MNRAFYTNNLKVFLNSEPISIFGEITSNDQYSAEDLQKNTWKKEIEILQGELSEFNEGHILFEYTIPRMGKRIDCIFLYKGLVFLLEFKVGENGYPKHAVEQVIDYALDLNCFHKESHNKLLVPILISTDADELSPASSFLQNNILDVVYCNQNNIGKSIREISSHYPKDRFDPETWINSIYMPTPTIIEAAQTLYKGHNVEEISRNDATAKNLNQTTKEINSIIDFSKENKRKSICFVTGVPGAGKTLAGLNIAIERQKIDEDEHAVFLSGNGPLVEVLQEALARDEHQRTESTKTEARRKSKEFIQNIHHFRDDALSIDSPPIEKVVIFDEAQRAWDEQNLASFMKRKKGIPNFKMSEPDFLINILDRHEEWTTIVCLIGGGQEINKGESEGLYGWLEALRNKYSKWDIYVSETIMEDEYSGGLSVNKLLDGLNYKFVSDLHLAVPLRSFRSENVSNFVKALLDVNEEAAKALFENIFENYPIYLTRNLESAKSWIKDIAKGSQRYGLTASSGAKRLRKYGVWVQNKIEACAWFLNDKEDVRSSLFLEETATEFDIQGLELDYTIVCWDANLRFNGEKFETYNFTGTKWQNINKEEHKLYLKNAYRVLLTRARQGFIIFIPEGDKLDLTRLPDYYEGTYQYFKKIGIKEI